MKDRIRNFVANLETGLANLSLRSLANDVIEKDLFKHASAMAYSTLLSIVPSLAASFSLVAFFIPGPIQEGIVGDIKTWILSKLTEGTGQEVTDRLDTLVSGLDAAQLGITSFLGLIFSLALLLRQIELTFNEIWGVSKNRNILLRLLYFSGFVLLCVGLLGSGLQVWQFLGFDKNSLSSAFQTNATSLAHWPLSLVLSFIFFLPVFKLIPNCHVSLVPAVIGAIISSLGFQFSKAAFLYYVSNIADYQLIYGALAALPLFLLWLYICWLMALFGAVISWRVQKGFAHMLP